MFNFIVIVSFFWGGGEMFYLGFLCGFVLFFEVQGKSSQEIQTTFASIFGVFWIVFLSKVKKKWHLTPLLTQSEDHGLSSFSGTQSFYKY